MSTIWHHYDMGLRPNDPARNWDGDGVVFGFTDYSHAVAHTVTSFLTDATEGGTASGRAESAAYHAIVDYVRSVSVEGLTPRNVTMGEWSIIVRPVSVEDCEWCEPAPISLY